MKVDSIKRKPFESFVDLDSVTYNCPCGGSVSGEGKIIANFIKNHKKHTNGYCRETITDDGARILSGPRTRKFKIE